MNGDSSSGSDSASLAAELDGVVERLYDGEDVETAELEAGELRDLLPVMKLLTGLGEGSASGAEPTTPKNLQNVHLGDFRILRELGRGGMGFVFEAMQLSLNRRVALKILPAAVSLDSGRLARFEREARAAATLEHPHIVRAYAHGQEQGTYYLAMQLIQGEDLSQVIRRQRAANLLSAQASTVEREQDNRNAPASEPGIFGTDSMAGSSSFDRSALTTSSGSSSNGSARDASYFRNVARLGQHVAEALQYAHERGIIHRDIKPSNLLLDQRSHVWVTDFGLATFEAASELTATGKVLGTLRYCSPEQTRGARDLDARTDIYSIGATLYELATLQPAFEDPEPAAMLKAILEEEPQRPRKLVPKIPADLESVILKAMAKSPRHRYKTALELAVDLQRFQCNEPVMAQRPTVIGRSIRWMQRNRLVSLLLAGITILLCAVVIGAVVHSARQNELFGRLNRSNMRLTETLGNLNETLDRERELRGVVEAEEQLARERYYAADLANIARLADVGQYDLVYDRLQRHVPQAGQDDTRGFMWRHLRAHCNDVRVTLNAHQHEVLATAFAPTMKLLVTGDEFGTILVWDTTTWHQQRSLSFEGEVWDIEFSPDETLLAVCGTNGIIELYQTDEWELTHSIKAHDMTAKGLAFTPDGKTLISGSRNHDIAYWDTATWQELRRFIAHDTVQHIAASADGRWLASGGSDGLAKVWNVTSGEMAAEARSEESMLATALSADGRLVASGGYELRVRLTDRATSESLSVINTRYNTWSLRFSHDDTRLTIGDGGGFVTIYDISNPRDPRPVRMAKVHDGVVRTLQWLGGKNQLVTSSDDTTIRVTSLPEARAERIRSLGDDRRAAFSPHAERFAVAHRRGQFAVYDRSGRQIASGANPRFDTTPEDGAPRLAFDSRSALWAATISQATAQFSVVSPAGEIRTHHISHDRELASIWLSNRAEYALAIDRIDQGILWRLDDFTKVGQFAVSAGINDLAFSSDNATIALVSDSGELQLIDCVTGSEQQLATVTPTGSPAWLFTVCFDPSDSIVAVAGEEGTVYLWDVESGELRQEMLHQTTVGAIAFSNDGRYLVSASNDLRVWHVETGLLITQLGPSYGDRYWTVAFSPNDACLIAVGDNSDHGVLHIWDTADARSRDTRSLKTRR